MTDFQDISEYIRLGKDSVDLLKSAAGLLPKGSKREEIEKKISAAEETLQRNDAKLAKELGLKLCDCTWPPQTMRWRELEKSHVCPKESCGRKLSAIPAYTSLVEPCPICGVANLKTIRITDHPVFGRTRLQEKHLRCENDACGHTEKRMHDPLKSTKGGSGNIRR